VQTSALRTDRSSEPLLALLPHQHKLVKETPSTYSLRTVRGLLKILVGYQFHYDLPFYGVVPSYTLPTADSFSASDMTRYLQSLNAQTDPLNPNNFYNSPTPYWNSKATYPLTQGILIAEQLGLSQLKDTFLLKLQQHLVDWFTFTNTEDARYLYYNDRWGTTYYSDNEFNTASEISDHSFTHGYLIFASAILSRLDRTFYQQYREMILLLMKDYMNHDPADLRFPVMRSFDRYAGHSWAHGFGSFAEGNNLESTGEAINSWVAAYHFAQLENNRGMMDAAIYGYVHETYAAQQYWFDYDQDIWSQKYREYAGVAGIVWGGKYDYATWFGANPTFIYGIQWIPTGEYLGSYITGANKKARLTAIYQKYLNARNGAVDRWYAYMWPVQALVNPSTARGLFDETKILNDEYPAELSMAYYMMQALQSYAHKVDDAYMRIHPSVSSSIYLNTSGQRVALTYNASQTEQTITFVVNGVVQTKTIAANAFVSIALS
jgi:endo-1,3(4)-beta-glucanase